jgi:hypothetical protein
MNNLSLQFQFIVFIGSRYAFNVTSNWSGLRRQLYESDGNCPTLITIKSTREKGNTLQIKGDIKRNIPDFRDALFDLRHKSTWVIVLLF